MLPHPARLNLKTDFKWVAAGKSIQGEYLKIFTRFGNNPSPRVGIATSAKVFKKAVDRNRARRLIATAFTSLYDQLPSAINLVALPKAGIISQSSDKITQEIKQLLNL